jgi:alcohol dehydrogenase class IV
MPRAVTAATGIDALTHCIEAYANRLAHPMVDALALEGITPDRRILEPPAAGPATSPAREAMLRASHLGEHVPRSSGSTHAQVARARLPLGGRGSAVAHTGSANSLPAPAT